MSDNLTIIRTVLDEHQNIKKHIGLVGEHVTDWEGLMGLEKARLDWVPGRPGDLIEKQEKLKEMMSLLGDGLQKHFNFEEKVLPPLLGELLMEALVLEHREIAKKIDEARLTVVETRLEGLSREESLFKESAIQQTIDTTCRLVGEHANKEEIILGMLQRLLEQKGQNRS